MRLIGKFLAAAALFLAPVGILPAWADPPTYAQTVTACGTPNNTPVVGNSYPVTMDRFGQVCGAGSVTGTVTANQGAPNAGGTLAWPVIPDSVQDSQQFTGSATSATTLVTLNTTGYGYIEFQFTSAGSGNTIAVESSNDGTPGVGSTFLPALLWSSSAASAFAQTSASTLTANFVAPVTGSTMRLRVSNYTSGTVTVVGSLKRGPAPPWAVGQVFGNVASGSADSGNPVKVGGTYHATQPTFADGSRGDAQIDAYGNARVTLQQGTNTAVVNGAADGAAVANGVVANSRLMIFNGTTWDRQRSIQGIDGTGLGVQAVEEGGRSFSEITTATDTVVKSGAGTLHAVNVNTCVSGATVKIYNATSAIGTPITITCPANTAGMPTFIYDAYFGTGITVRTSGATDVTVTYR